MKAIDSARRSILAAAIVTLTALSAAVTTQAALIAVENYSFEAPDLGHDTALFQRNAGPVIAGWTSVNDPTISGRGVGVIDPWDAEYTGTNGPVLPGTAEGAQFGFMNMPSGTSNTFRYTGFSLGNFVAGETYTLTVALGGRLNSGLVSAFTIGLSADGTSTGAGTTGTAIRDTFYDLIYSFTATAAEDGKAIGIQLTAANTAGNFQQANFDNVRLTGPSAPVTAVPEPTTALFGAALLGAIGLSRRRKGQEVVRGA